MCLGLCVVHEIASVVREIRDGRVGMLVLCLVLCCLGTGKRQVLERGLLNCGGPPDRGGGAVQRGVPRAGLIGVAGSLLGLEGLRRFGEGGLGHPGLGHPS